MTLKKSTLAVGLVFGFMVYLAINSHVDVTSNYPAFSSRSLMNHPVTANSASDIVSNPAVINAIDQMITSVGKPSTSLKINQVNISVSVLVCLMPYVGLIRSDLRFFRTHLSTP